MNSTPPDPDKPALRRHFRERRRRAIGDGGPLLTTRIQTAAADLLLDPAVALPAGLHIGLYWPLPGEIDLLSLAQRAPVALPVVAAGQLHYRSWRPGEPLQPDGCGIPAPGPAAAELGAEQLGLLLIPALAMDPGGIRLGSGGGWYDRLRAEPIWRRPLALAVLPASCCDVPLPRDPWDVPLDGWVSEQGLRRCPGSGWRAANSHN